MAIGAELDGNVKFALRLTLTPHALRLFNLLGITNERKCSPISWTGMAVHGG